jgi:TPR repeat protein
MLDPAEGLRKYRALAEAGDAEAMVGVGVVLLEGVGRDLDAESTAEGLMWVKQATKLGNTQGIYELAVMHYLGDPVEEDEAAAFDLFKRAAEQDHTGGLFMLAECFLTGIGCERDLPQAVVLLHRAASRGHRMARQYVLEWMEEDEAVYPRKPPASGRHGCEAEMSGATQRRE